MTDYADERAALLADGWTEDEVAIHMAGACDAPRCLAPSHRATYGALVLGDVVVHGRAGRVEVTRIEDQGEGWRCYDLYDGNGTTYGYSHHNDEAATRG
jgi:hypothetical protein